ncbi:ArdC family protein [Ktedonobacter racemifer]|uniref:N-terminal domain-containing protein n=1 Tax=Ktedonobacter racemifer DSM 44963 TaxID=485913 RepID=D6U8R2_KTERA|nr:ArdC family protein [Ktedonobacter racemifer]EFH79622.1 conserved hypothetical protein [Ktedonobacter racemifer DSM 44963]
MTKTTKRTLQDDPKKAEQAAAFRQMAALLDGELKEGKHEQRLKKARQESTSIARYSPLNQLLILTQCPHVTVVHGYVEWKDLGFQVRKGEKGIAIRAPHAKAPQGEDAGTVGFHRMYVFDKSQVDPITTDEQTPEPGAAPQDQDNQPAPAPAAD